MKIDIKILRWVFLILYIAIIVGLLGMAYSGIFSDMWPVWLSPLSQLEGELFWTLFIFMVTVISQALFILVPGTTDLCRPIRRRRLAVPVIIASFMMAVLVGVFFASMVELLDVDAGDWFILVFWIVIGLSWIVWGVFFFMKYKEVEHYKTLKKLISTMVGGSLIELLAAIPSHIIVSRRPGCFVGALTASGIAGGIAVMLWAFGPGIIFLFLHEKYKAELRQNKRRQHKV